MDDLKTFIDSTDYSKSLNDYIRDAVTFSLTSSQEILIGLYKPFSELYIDVETQAVESYNMSFEYYNGTTFVSLSVDDFSNGFKRSGFINWDKPEDWASSTQLSNDLFWIRVSVDADFTGLELNGINIVFSEDNDLTEEYRNINKYIYNTDSSFISYHQAARKEIIQTLRNEGNEKKREDENYLRNINKWDLLEIDEVREASKFITLSKIFYEIHDSEDDVFQQKAKRYETKGNEALNLYILSLDSNDDGVKDNTERGQIQYGKVRRA